MTEDAFTRRRLRVDGGAQTRDDERRLEESLCGLAREGLMRGAAERC